MRTDSSWRLPLGRRHGYVGRLRRHFRAVLQARLTREHDRLARGHTLDRLDEIESLARTREISLKDLTAAGEFRAVVATPAGSSVASLRLVKEGEEEEEPEHEIKLDTLSEALSRMEFG